MSCLKTRRRLVNFRLTDDELASLKVACLIEGARNISEFARQAVLQSAQAHLYPESRNGEFFALVAERLARIEAALDGLAAGTGEEALARIAKRSPA